MEAFYVSLLWLLKELRSFILFFINQTDFLRNIYGRINWAALIEGAKSVSTCEAHFQFNFICVGEILVMFPFKKRLKKSGLGTVL